MRPEEELFSLIQKGMGFFKSLSDVAEHANSTSDRESHTFPIVDLTKEKKKKRYEYLVINPPTDSNPSVYLNAKEKQGWRLVAVDQGKYYFRRRKGKIPNGSS